MAQRLWAAQSSLSDQAGNVWVTIGMETFSKCLSVLVQDKLYKEKFSALPGLNSPARLIREIVRPPRSRLHAASSAAPGAAETSPATPV
jgi:hypothetical protein